MGSSVAGSLVSNAAYNRLGQLEQIKLGTATQNVQYRYYGLNFQTGQRPLYGRLRGICVTSTTTACGDIDTAAPIRMNQLYTY
jgi:hypothetical protein